MRWTQVATVGMILVTGCGDDVGSVDDDGDGGSSGGGATSDDGDDGKMSSTGGDGTSDDSPTTGAASSDTAADGTTDGGADGVTSDGADESTGETSATTDATDDSGTTGGTGETGETSGEDPECGDGNVDPGEQCDDGNLMPGDGCDELCRDEVSPACGNGRPDPGEACDDGNADDDDACLSNCTQASCGDGFVWEGEETCDDGNAVDGDGCSQCVVDTCGNGMPDPGEQCDNGGANGTPGNVCYEDCTRVDIEFDRRLDLELDILDQGRSPWTIAVDDLNGDGWLDLATANYDSASHTTLLGFGDGDFWAPRVEETGLTPRALAVGDFDEDGSPDVVTASASADAVTLVRGDGRALRGAVDFSVRVGGLGDGPRDVAAADLDGDGHLDVVSANDDDTVTILYGDGTGQFGDAEAITTFVDGGGNNPQAIALGDVTDDGILDIVTANDSDDVSLFVGLGGRSFSGARIFTTRFGAGGDDPVDLVLADVTGDGVPDAITANRISDDMTVLVSDPDAEAFEFPVRFSTLTDDGGETPSAIVAGDLDGDGETDIVTANESDDDITVFLGVFGGATFEPGVHYPISIGTTGNGDSPAEMQISDMNGDGILDIVTVNLGSGDVSILLGEGDGSFEAPSVFTTTVGYRGSAPNDVGIADFNHDGLLDVVVSHGSSSDVVVLGGLGDARLATSQTRSVTGSPQDVEFVELDGDGLMDVAVSTSVNRFERDHQTVNGSFNTAASNLLGSDLEALDFADINGDGDLDAAFASRSNGQLYTFLNDGDTSFSTLRNYTSPSAYDVRFAHVNADALVDLVTVNPLADEIRVYLASGSGMFSGGTSYSTSQSTSGDFPAQMVVADMDGDGIEDVLTANRNSNDVSLLVGNGNGSFDAPVIIPMLFSAQDADTYAVATGDFDGDALLDIAAVHSERDSVTVVFGFGGTDFSAPQEFEVGDGPRALVVADFDGDGLDDVATANRYADTVTIRLSSGR